MSDIVGTFRSYALDKDNCPRMGSEVIPVRVSLLLEAADEIERLLEVIAGYRTDNERLRSALDDCLIAASTHHIENVARAEWSGSSIAQRKARAIAARSGVLRHNIKAIVNGALEGKPRRTLNELRGVFEEAYKKNLEPRYD